jgi:hypothetical protein
MRWVTIKPVAAQKADKLSAKSQYPVPASAARRAAKHVAVDIEKTDGQLRWERMFAAEAPFELRHPRASWGFFGFRP